jgi:hypothetical protein
MPREASEAAFAAPAGGAFSAMVEDSVWSLRRGGAEVSKSWLAQIECFVRSRHVFRASPASVRFNGASVNWLGVRIRHTSTTSFTTSHLTHQQPLYVTSSHSCVDSLPPVEPPIIAYAHIATTSTFLDRAPHTCPPWTLKKLSSVARPSPRP